MGDNSAIEWTDATWNPVRGCSIVSKGCTNCYAMRQAHRSSGPGGAYEGLTKLTKGGPVWTGAIRTVPELLDQPLRWRRPRRIFVNSMSDLFHEDVGVIIIGSVLGIASACPQHAFQVLTKRPRRMRDVLASEEFLESYESSQAMHTHNEVPWPPPNVWLGVSVEDQASADERIPLLVRTPAAVRWISAEPLLGPIDITPWLREVTASDPRNPLIHAKLDWAVVGGESGPGARPMHPDWVRSLRNQCGAAGVPFFFKQWGAWRSIRQDEAIQYLNSERLYNAHRFPRDGQWRDVSVYRLGKKLAGRELDGRTHDGYPNV